MVSGNDKSPDAHETEAEIAVAAAAGRPAGLPDRPLTNRPRRSRSPCSPCFIRLRLGIGNSFNRNCTRSRVPMPRRFTMRIWRLHDYLFVKPSREQRATGGPRDPHWDARFYPLGEIIAELNRVPGSRAKAQRGLSFERGWREGSTVPIAAMAEPGFAEPKPCRRISHVTSETKKLNRYDVA